MEKLDDKRACKNSSDRDYKKYLLLDNVFHLKKELVSGFHKEQVLLYIKFAPEKIMGFLKLTDRYSSRNEFFF